MPSDPSDETETEAWIDGELDLPRRHAVEARLAADPPAAARVFAMLRDRTALRLIAAPASDVPATLAASAERLSQQLARPVSAPWHRSWAGRLSGAVAAALAIALVVPEAAAERAPAYVDDAVAAYRTSLIRARMQSQVETPVADAREIAGATRLRVPQLPRGWRVTDVQLVPAEDGTALQIMAQMPDSRVVSIFAVRSEDGNGATPSASPEAVAQGSDAAAYWSDGETSYALIGPGTPEAVDTLAERVAAEQSG